MACGEPHWLELVTYGPQGWAGVEDLLRAMDVVGMERSVLQGWYWQSAETCRLHNAAMSAWVAAHPDRLSFFASTVPGHPEATEIVRSARLEGAIGAGELFPPINGVSLHDPSWDELLHQFEEWDWPVLLHTAEPVGHHYPGRVAVPLQDYVDMVHRHPGVRFILAHWGGGLPFYHLNPKLCASLPNVYYDTAASPLLFRPEVWTVALSCVDPDLVLFGSDYPLRIYPRLSAEAGLQRFVREAFEYLPANVLQRVKSTNAAKLLQLPHG